MIPSIVFVVLSHLKVRAPVRVRGIGFARSCDLEGITPEIATNLKSLCEMFFRSNGARIEGTLCRYV
jgi:hypothetical protein